MDKLKGLILELFHRYLRKLARGYILDPKEYANIVEAMRIVSILENFTFTQPVIDATISAQILKLKTT